MSILIEGMEMPKNCDGCVFCQSSLGLDYYCPLAKDYREYEELNRGRMDNCPIVEVPEPHGRLIDADALLSDVRKNSESYFADDFAHEWVDVAPTVIPASREET